MAEHHGEELPGVDAQLQQQGKLHFYLSLPLSTSDPKLKALLSHHDAWELKALLCTESVINHMLFSKLCCWPTGQSQQPPGQAAHERGLLWPGRLLSLSLHPGAILSYCPSILVLHAGLPRCAIGAAYTYVQSHALPCTAEPCVEATHTTSLKQGSR